MATMSLDKEIRHYLPLLGSEQKKKILKQIRSFLASEEAPKRMTKEEFIIQYNKELEEAEKRVAQGDFIAQEDLERESENWQHED